MLLEQAACDVAVLVAREGSELELGAERPVLVPFGGAEHDWAALELGSWLASSTGAPLKLLGAAGQTDEGKSVTRMLADAGPARPAGHRASRPSRSSSPVAATGSWRPRPAPGCS